MSITKSRSFAWDAFVLTGGKVSFSSPQSASQVFVDDSLPCRWAIPNIGLVLVLSQLLPLASTILKAEPADSSDCLLPMMIVYRNQQWLMDNFERQCHRNSFWNSYCFLNFNAHIFTCPKWNGIFDLIAIYWSCTASQRHKYVISQPVCLIRFDVRSASMKPITKDSARRNLWWSFAFAMRFTRSLRFCSTTDLSWRILRLRWARTATVLPGSLFGTAYLCKEFVGSVLFDK